MIVLLVVGVLTALGLAGDAAGGVGRGLGSVAGALFGVARFVVPVVCIGLAVLCFWWRPREVSLVSAEASESGDDAARAWREGWEQGDPEASNTFVGEAVGLIRGIEPVADVIEGMGAQAAALLGVGPRADGA